jgi:hypothetical protein
LQELDKIVAAILRRAIRKWGMKARMTRYEYVLDLGAEAEEDPK